MIVIEIKIQLKKEISIKVRLFWITQLNSKRKFDFSKVLFLRLSTPNNLFFTRNKGEVKKKSQITFDSGEGVRRIDIITEILTPNNLDYYVQRNLKEKESKKCILFLDEEWLKRSDVLWFSL